MLKFVRTTYKKGYTTEYEDVELDYAIHQMEESFWNEQSTNQAVIDDKNMIIYVMSDDAKILNEYLDYVKINQNDN